MWLGMKLRNGGFVRVAGMNRVTEPWLAEAAGKNRFDVVWFDMKHKPLLSLLILELREKLKAQGP